MRLTTAYEVCSPNIEKTYNRKTVKGTYKKLQHKVRVQNGRTEERI